MLTDLIYYEVKMMQQEPKVPEVLLSQSCCRPWGSAPMHALVRLGGCAWMAWVRRRGGRAAGAESADGSGTHVLQEAGLRRPKYNRHQNI